MPVTPSVRVVVRLPWNRPHSPDVAIADPPAVSLVVSTQVRTTSNPLLQIEWTAEKADILWKVIERSRSSDSGGTDCEWRSTKHVSEWVC